MKAVQFHRYGGSETLVYEDAEQPVPGPGQVLVRVAGTSFNPVDSAIRSGYLQQAFPLQLPHVPGIDLAGTVAGVGDDVTDWKEGDAVVAFLPMNENGAAAEYAIAPAELLAAAPHAVALSDAAALPAVGLTAWQSLFEHGQLRSGQRVLVNGAGGAVGGYAVQLAKEAGAIVTVTASPRSAERLRGYRADRIIDHTDSPLTAQLAGERFDVVLNLVNTTEAETSALLEYVSDDGALVSTTTPPPSTDDGRGVRTVRVFARSDSSQLAELVARVNDGRLRIDVAQRRPLEDLPAIHAQADAGQLPGKTIVRP